jgi:hypothetical protein
VAGILPDVFWNLTWNDYDSLLFNHHYREQQMLRGHREVATRIYNSLGSFSKNFRPIAADAYWQLPLIDPKPKKFELPPEEWWEKMRRLAEASGKRFAPIND